MQNKRESIRVNVSFPISIKRIDADTYEKTKDNYIQHKTSDRENLFSPMVDQLSLDLTDRKFDKIDPVLLHLTNTMSKKLDIIIGMLNAKTIKKKNIDTAICKDISSGGLLLYTSKKLTEKDIIELRIEFPVFPPLTVVALGTIVKVMPKKDEYEISVEFVAINNDDREDLIGYLFKRQRELLRSRKDK